MANIVKKSIICIFISILMIFSMSDNIFATDVVPGNANLNGWNSAPQLNCWRYYSAYDNGWTGWNPACFIAPGASNVSVKAIQLRGASGGQIWANPGDILQIQIAMVADLTENQPQIYYLPNDSSSLQVISMKVDGSFTAKEGKQLILTYYAKYVGSVSNPSSVQLGSNSINARDIFAYGSMSYYITGYSVSSWSSSLPNNDDVVNAIEEMSEQQAQQNEDIRNELEQGQDDLNDAGSSSQTDAESASSSLLSVISGFFGVITGASPTNCIIDAPLNTYFDNTRLRVDLCALSLPPGIGALTSIIAIMVLVPFAIHMFKKFISIFRSFQG